MQYPNVGHKICMLNEKNDDNKNFKKRRNKVIIINNIKNSREIYFLIRRNKT